MPGVAVGIVRRWRSLSGRGKTAKAVATPALE
jgi:hypothetical protein